MKSLSFAVALLILVAAATAPTEIHRDTNNILQTDKLAEEGLFNLAMFVAKRGNPEGKCTLDNVAIRKEWGALSNDEKKDYISAVQCLSKKPPKTPTALAPGVKNRYDDFVATHINQTMWIHGTGNFLAWHRYFTWTYEQALRSECGYKGYQPYWNWAKYSDDPEHSPVFDGSETSMSGNGAKFERPPTCIPAESLCQIRLPIGNGGGCLTSGPFKDWKVNLGPVSPALPNVPPNRLQSGLGYNPRCVRRDISKAASTGWTKDTDIVTLILSNSDPYWFITLMQGDFPVGNLGIHTGGHFTIGGDPGGDLFVSPGDPAFFLHHAMIDRVWWTWQNLDLVNRLYAVGATVTLNNFPPSRNATLDDTINLGVNAGPISIRNASNTVAGPFCYIYA